MARITNAPAVIAPALLALLLSGCAAAGSTPPGTEAELTAASAAPTAASGEASVDPAAAPDCAAVFIPGEADRLAAEGHVRVDEPFLLGPVMERMAAEGALVCVWSKPNSDASVSYARLEVGDAGATWLAELEAAGWLEDTERGDGTYLAPADYDPNFQPSVQLADGVLHFGSHNLVLQQVAELG